MDDPSLRQTSYAVIAVATLLAALVAAWLVRDATTEDISLSNPPVTAAAPVGGPRGDKPEFCVQTVNVDNSVQGDATARINKILAEMRELRLPNFALRPDTVDAGCPVGPAAHDDRACGSSEIIIARYCMRIVEELGRYRMLIYILPKSEIERLVPRNESRINPEEAVCGGDVCDELSHGLLLSPAEIRDETILRYWLYNASGLDCFLPAAAYSRGDVGSVNLRSVLQSCLRECDDTLLSRNHICKQEPR